MTSSIPGVVISTRRTWPDDRGNFLELFRSDEYAEEFVQFNHSFSVAGVLRGLHWHRHQADLWYVVGGRAQIALVDVRGEKPVVETFELDSASATTVYIPPFVAHGYMALDDLDLIYAVTRTYDPTDENGIAWDDPDLAIPWERSDPIISRRDATNPRLPWPAHQPFS